MVYTIFIFWVVKRAVNPWVTGSNPVQPEALLGRFSKLNKTPMCHIP